MHLRVKDGARSRVPGSRDVKAEMLEQKDDEAVLCTTQNRGRALGPHRLYALHPGHLLVGGDYLSHAVIASGCRKISSIADEKHDKV